MSKTGKKAPEGDDRVITRTDNNPPEPVGLPVAGEVAGRYQEQTRKLIDEHLPTFLMFTRAPGVIEDKDVYDRVTTLSGIVKKAFDAIDKARSAAKKPYLDGGSAVDKAFALTVEIDDPASPGDPDDPEKPGGRKSVDLLAEMKKAHAELKGRLSAYDTMVYRKEEEDRQAEQAALAAAAAADGIVLGADAGGDGRMASSRSEHGGTAVRNVTRTFEVTDATMVPASLCSPDPQKIQAAIDAGAKEIPGVRIDVQVKTHTR
jgi:hypothetical protein